MLNNSSHRKQRGFFDFGIGLGLLALFGGTAVVVNQDNSDQREIVQQGQVPAVQVSQVIDESE